MNPHYDLVMGPRLKCWDENVLLSFLLTCLCHSRLRLTEMGLDLLNVAVRTKAGSWCWAREGCKPGKASAQLRTCWKEGKSSSLKRPATPAPPPTQPMLARKAEGHVGPPQTSPKGVCITSSTRPLGAHCCLRTVPTLMSTLEGPSMGWHWSVSGL